MSKFHRGDKFVIEIAEKHTHYNDRDESYALYRIKGFNSLVFDDNGLNKLTKLDNHKKYVDEKNYIFFKYQIALNTITNFIKGERTYNKDVMEIMLQQLQCLIRNYNDLLYEYNELQEKIDDTRKNSTK